MRWATAIACLSLGASVLADPPRDERHGHPVPEPKPETEAIPKEHAGEKDIAIKLEKVKQHRSLLGVEASLRIINPTDKDMIYTGLWASSPHIRRQQWKDGRWVEAELTEDENTKPGWSHAITLPAGQSVVFTMNIGAEQMPARIGLDCTQEGKAKFTVWSDRIER